MKGARQAGFGLLETLTGLLVFVVLAMMGTKAYRNVVANHTEASHVKALTDAVARTAEGLSGLTLDVLAGRDRRTSIGALRPSSGRDRTISVTAPCPGPPSRAARTPPWWASRSRPAPWNAVR